MDPKPGTLGNLGEAAWEFGRDAEEREAYLDYLRATGASDEYISAIESYWDARDGVRDEVEDLWTAFVDLVKGLFGAGDGRSG